MQHSHRYHSSRLVLILLSQPNSTLSIGTHFDLTTIFAQGQLYTYPTQSYHPIHPPLSLSLSQNTSLSFDLSLALAHARRPFLSSHGQHIFLFKMMCSGRFALPIHSVCQRAQLSTRHHSYTSFLTFIHDRPCHHSSPPPPSIFRRTSPIMYVSCALDF